MDNLQQTNISGSLENKDNVPERRMDLDEVLEKELGQFGRFQLKNILLVAIPLMFTAFMTEFVFSGAAIPHRYVHIKPIKRELVGNGANNLKQTLETDTE